MQLDLILVSNIFFDATSLSKEKEYLLKYFDAGFQQQFVLYYYHIGHELYRQKGYQYFFNCFVDHTGYFCSEKYLFKMLERYLKLEKLVEACKTSGDMIRLSEIRSGSLKMNKLC